MTIMTIIWLSVQAYTVLTEAASRISFSFSHSSSLSFSFLSLSLKLRAGGIPSSQILPWFLLSTFLLAPPVVQIINGSFLLPTVVVWPNLLTCNLFWPSSQVPREVRVWAMSLNKWQLASISATHINVSDGVLVRPQGLHHRWFKKFFTFFYFFIQNLFLFFERIYFLVATFFYSTKPLKFWDKTTFKWWM